MKRRSLFVLITAIFLILSSCVQTAVDETALACSQNNIIVLKNCVLIDGTGASPRRSAEIMIRGGKLAKITTRGKIKVPRGSKVLDLKGAVVLPGFINAHVHRAYDSSNLQNWLNGGVTTVRDLAPLGIYDFIKARDEFNKNPKNSRIVSATPIMSVPGGYDGTDYYNSPEDARNKVLNYIDKGVDIIKFSIEDELQGRQWTLPTYEEVKSIVDTAHSGKKKVSVHIMHARNLRWAIDAGVDDVAHMVVEPVDSGTINDMIKKNIYWIPTLELIKGVSEMHSLDWDVIAADNLSKFYKAGGKIALGTDFGGYMCNFDRGFPKTEVLLMQKAGMKNMDIIVAGTKNAAIVCGLSKEIGTIEEGKKADILVVNGDPLSDIKALFNASMVIHNGTIIKK
ncbi:MAG: amidohydrolase family protein [Clostridia bacterium]|nr:amidohydrolase family protein [Clostridia bacterium]